MKRIVIGVVIAAIIALVIWAIPLAPHKEVIVTTTEVPLTEEEREYFGYDQESLTAYLVYYVWDGEREEHPWWSIFQNPFNQFEWIVLETRAIDDIHGTMSFARAVESASKFDKYWFEHASKYVQRSRLEKLQKAIFGAEGLEKERRAIEQILKSIHSQ